MIRVLLAMIVLFVLAPGVVQAQEPDWSGSVVAIGERRDTFRSAHVLNRPYRPFHFYGNTVRRRHYRGSAAPLPRDVVLGSRALIRSTRRRR